MKKDFKKMSLSRGLLGGILCGIITAVIVALYVYFYRTDTNLEKFAVLGPTIIFTGVPLLLVIAGVVYYLFVHYFAKGETLYVILFSVLTIVNILLILNLTPVGKESLLSIPHGILFGTVLITGLSACIFLPYLVHHPKIFMTGEEIKLEN